MAAFVLDASATLPWCFADEATPATDGLLERLQNGEEAIVPPHWALEVANGLLVAVRRNRIFRKDALQFLQDLEFLPVRLDISLQDRLRATVFPLAEQFGLAVYDAAYLELAIRERLPLATLDDGLRKAARAAGASLI